MGHYTGVEQSDGGGDEGPRLQLQRALLPGPLPKVDGLPLTARYFPAGSPDRIGGDWYDVIPIEGGAVALIVGDVAGADLAAAALTAQLRGAVRAYALEGPPPAVVVTRANEFCLALGTGRPVSLAYALVHPEERIVTVVRAGHLAPLLATPGSAPCLLDGAGGPPLGVRTGEVWREWTLQVEPGSTLVLYADGTPDDDGTGPQRLLAAFGADPVAGPGDLADRVAGLVGDTPPDDAVLLVGHLVGQGPGGSTLRRALPPTAESASVARWLVTDLLKGRVDDDTRDTAALLTTELVSNAIRHTRDELVVSVQVSGGRLRVGVADSSHRRPQLVQVGRRDTSGRGLHLVDAMADRWGVDPDERGLGKTVWFELAAAADD